MHSDAHEADDSLEPILETIDPAEVAVVKSLLGSAGIPFLTRGEDQYDAFRGAFRGTVFSSRGRPIVFMVPRHRATDARTLLDNATRHRDECTEDELS
jgi:hypothetical protein